jgi:hypothetical protein
MKTAHGSRRTGHGKNCEDGARYKDYGTRQKQIEEAFP